MNLELAEKILESNMDAVYKEQAQRLLDTKKELYSKGYRDIVFYEDEGWKAIPTLESHKDWTEKDGEYFINGIPVLGYDPVKYDNRIPGFFTIRQIRPGSERTWRSLVCGFDLLEDNKIAVLAKVVDNWETAMQQIEKHKDYDTPLCFTIEEPISIRL